MKRNRHENILEPENQNIKRPRTNPFIQSITTIATTTTTTATNMKIPSFLPSNQCKEDRELVLQALRKSCYDYIYISEDLKHDKEIVLLVITRNSGVMFEDIPQVYKNDHNMVLAMVKECGLALKRAPNRFTRDLQISLAAVEDYIGALKYVDKKIRYEKSIVRAAYYQYRYKKNIKGYTPAGPRILENLFNKYYNKEFVQSHRHWFIEFEMIKTISKLRPGFVSWYVDIVIK
jgi:hypothetical protein